MNKAMKTKDKKREQFFKELYRKNLIRKRIAFMNDDKIIGDEYVSTNI